MNLTTATLQNCSTHSGLVVVIDVLRAFTTAAYAFHQGVREILLTSTIDEALALRERFPGSLCMGEVDGFRPPEFDLGNSPAELDGLDLSGRRLIHRTTAGTQGVVRSVNARALYAASFVVADATARAIRAEAAAWTAQNPASQTPEVCFVITGIRDPYDGDEDQACADYISALLREEAPDPAPFLERVRTSGTGRRFIHPPGEEFAARDLDYATALDRFDFALRIQREDGLLVMRPVR